MNFDMNAFSLEGKVALITGASHGIGMAIAEAFAAAGATICFNCSSENSRDRALKAYKEDGVDAHGYVCDVTDETQVQALVKQISPGCRIV